MFIAVEGVSKSFGRQAVLQNVSLAVKEQEIFGLLGPSGAGKTTLVRLITGALLPDAGSVTVGGCRVPSFDALRKVGFMPQEDALYADLSGYDNLRFFASLFGLKKQRARRRIEEVLTLVDLTADAKKQVAHYSGGMRRRLSLAIALLHDPPLLILDEPTVGIDPLLRRRIWEEFQSLRAQGRTILITTHVMDEAARCDRLGLVYGGGILACDTVQNLLARTQHGSLEELFLAGANGGWAS